MAAYLESEDHAKLQETLSKAEDEDEYKNDTDPHGFFTFKKLVSATRLFYVCPSLMTLLFIFLSSMAN